MENRKFLKSFLFRHKILSVALLLTLFLIVVSYLDEHPWILYFSNRIKGQAIDVETKKPIEGAIVVGLWKLSQIPGEGPCGYARVTVKTTDKEGNFSIPFWVAFKPWKFGCAMDDQAPQIIIYKPGYELYWSYKKAREGMKEFWDIYTPEQMKEIKEASSLNPAKLKKIYTDEERLKNYDEFSSHADFPGHHFTKKKSAIIFDALDEELNNISNKTTFDTKQLIISNKKLREFWTGGNKQ